MHHPTDRIAHTTAFGTPVMEHWLEREIAQWRIDPMTHHTMSKRSYHGATSRSKTNQTVRETICCHHCMGYSFWLTARCLLYAPFHTQDSTIHDLFIPAMTGTKTRSIGTSWGIDLMTYCTISRNYWKINFCLKYSKHYDDHRHTSTKTVVS